MTDQPPPPAPPAQPPALPPAQPPRQPPAWTSPVPAYGPSRFCQRCGASVEAWTATCARCGLAQPSGTGKDRLVAILLALFLGGLGLHKFYLGKTGQGIVYLLLCWTGIPSLVAWIETLIYLAKSDEAWAAEYGGPVQQPSGAALGCLWILALMPLLSIVAIIALIFLGGQVSSTLESVDSRLTNPAIVEPVGTAGPGESRGPYEAYLIAEAKGAPDDEAAQLKVADYYYENERYTEAKPWFERVLAIDGDSTEAMLALGAIAFNESDFEQAGRWWNRVALLDPSNQEVHYDLGFLAYVRTPPDLETARREWEEVIRLDPTSEIAEMARGYLEELRGSSMQP